MKIIIPTEYFFNSAFLYWRPICFIKPYDKSALLKPCYINHINLSSIVKHNALVERERVTHMKAHCAVGMLRICCSPHSLFNMSVERGYRTFSAFLHCKEIKSENVLVVFLPGHYALILRKFPLSLKHNAMHNLKCR